MRFCSLLFDYIYYIFFILLVIIEKLFTLSNIMNLYNLLFYISLIIIIGIACVIGCMVVCGYYIINWVGNDYTKTNQYILDMYGNCTIKKMYIVSEPIQHNGFIFLVNILTGYQYQKVVSSSKNYLPHHTSIILKIKSKNISKFI